MKNNSFEYKAFISYSRKDKVFAEWLFKKLEKYSIPNEISRKNKNAKKLGKFFRDMDELSSGYSLENELNTSLRNSEYLIVICSPDSAKSSIVNDEIKYFKTFRKNNIIPIIVRGEPNATTNHMFDNKKEAYAESLRFDVDSDGNITNKVENPLAPDIRKGKDSKEKAKTKIIATLLNVKFDTLWEREKRRLIKERLFYLLIIISFLVISLFATLEFIQKDNLKTSNYQLDLLNKSLVDKKAQLLKNISLKNKIKINKEIEQIKKDKIAVVNLQKSFGIYNEEWSIKAKNIFDKNGAKKAIEYLDSIESQKDEDKIVQKLSNKYRVKARLYIVNHQYKKAFESYEKAIKYKDSIELLDEYGQYAYNENNTKLAIKVYKKYKNKIEVFYKNDKNRWLKIYLTSLQRLSLAYYMNFQAKEGLKLSLIFIKIVEPLYKSNPDKWSYYYTSSLMNRALLYKKLNKIDKAFTLEAQAFDIIKPLYKKYPNKWKFPYLAILNNLSVSYRNFKKDNKAIKFAAEVLSIYELLYKKNSSKWAKDYIRSLYNLAESYREFNQSDKAIILSEKALVILKTLYNENPDNWVEAYTVVLDGLALSYKTLNQLYNAIKIEDEVLMLRGALYNKNPKKWAEFYVLSMNNRAIMYIDQNLTNKSFKLMNQALEIVNKLYIHNPDQWILTYEKLLNNVDNMKNKEDYDLLKFKIN